MPSARYKTTSTLFETTRPEQRAGAGQARRASEGGGVGKGNRLLNRPFFG